MYRFRYRSKNINGYSNWSPITYVRAATVPSRPPAPEFKTATATSITISVFSSLDDKGSEISSIQLWKNAGGTSTSYVKVADLSGSATEYTLYTTTPAHAITAGQIYKFKVITVNELGPSDFSDEIDGGVSSFPGQPLSPTKVESDSGETYITLQWLASSNTELPVIGYVLNMDDGYGGVYSVIYNGKNYPNVLKYTITGLTTGLQYRFTL